MTEIKRNMRKRKLIKDPLKEAQESPRRIPAAVRAAWIRISKFRNAVMEYLSKHEDKDDE